MGSMEVSREGDVRFLILKLPGVSVAMADMDTNGQAVRRVELTVELGPADGKISGVEIREVK